MEKKSPQSCKTHSKTAIDSLLNKIERDLISRYNNSKKIDIITFMKTMKIGQMMILNVQAIAFSKQVAQPRVL